MLHIPRSESYWSDSKHITTWCSQTNIYQITELINIGFVILITFRFIQFNSFSAMVLIIKTSSVLMQCRTMYCSCTHRVTLSNFTGRYVSYTLLKSSASTEPIKMNGSHQMLNTLSNACMANTGPSWAFTVFSNRVSFQI